MLTLCPVRSLPAVSSRSPVSIETRVDLPQPLGPIRQTCSPRSSHRSASSASTLSPARIVASSSSSTTRPERSAAPKLNERARESAGSEVGIERRTRSICFSFDWAWRALVAL